MTEYVTGPQLAQRLGITEQRVRQLIDNGTLLAEKIGRDWLIPETEALRFGALQRPAGRPLLHPKED